MLAVLPLEAITNWNYNKLFRLLRLPRIYKLSRAIKITKADKENVVVRFIDYINSSRFLKKIIEIMTKMLMCAHFAGCIFYFIAVLEDYSDDSWVMQ